jgi:hypothetical protein
LQEDFTMNRTPLLRCVAVATPVLLASTTALAGDRDHRYERVVSYEYRYEEYDGDRHCRRSCPEVDFERFDAGLYCTCDGWKLCVGYKIEIEDARCNDAFDLVLELRRCGHAVRDDDGKPTSFVIPLDCPDDIDDDELEFKGRFRTELPRDAFCCPKKHDVVAFVVDREDGRPISRCVRSRIHVRD